MSAARLNCKIMKYSFCPKCGNKLKIVKHENKTRLQCASCGFIFYQNAKPTASVLIENNKGEILLTRRAIEPLKGYWDTAGGFCEEDEHPENAARREIKEELGIDIEHGFRPEYQIVPRARNVLRALKSQIAKAENLYLATDCTRPAERPEATFFHKKGESL